MVPHWSEYIFQAFVFQATAMPVPGKIKRHGKEVLLTKNSLILSATGNRLAITSRRTLVKQSNRGVLYFIIHFLVRNSEFLQLKFCSFF